MVSWFPLYICLYEPSYPASANTLSKHHLTHACVRPSAFVRAITSKIWHTCSPWRVQVPFETFVRVVWSSRSHLEVNDDKMVINWACPGQNFYIYAWISKSFKQMFSLRSSGAIWNIGSGRLKGKVTLQGQMMKWIELAWAITCTFMPRLQNHLTQLFPLKSRSAIWNSSEVSWRSSSHLQLKL